MVAHKASTKVGKKPKIAKKANSGPVKRRTAAAADRTEGKREIACYLPLAALPDVEVDARPQLLSLPLPPENLLKGCKKHAHVGEEAGSGASEDSSVSSQDRHSTVEDTPPPTGSAPVRRAAAGEGGAPAPAEARGKKKKKGKAAKVAAGAKGGKSGAKSDADKSGGGKASKVGKAGVAAGKRGGGVASGGGIKSGGDAVLSDKQLVALERERQRQLHERRRQEQREVQQQFQLAHHADQQLASAAPPPASPRRRQRPPPTAAAPGAAFSEADASMAILLGLAGMRPGPRGTVLEVA